jgi:hypothetical protein
MKASDVLKKKGKADEKGSKKAGNALIDWIGKRRSMSKKKGGKY